ncbi:MAG: hypothetical protein GY869_28465 [Planctomycetes bacterium]|nr:hypothetical protein [Planctomycetota bacterium]
MTFPTNLAEAAAAISDGTLGLIQSVAIQDLAVSALTGLDGSDNYDITDKPIASGLTISDAAVKLPTIRQLHICLANPDFSVEAGLDAVLSGSFSGFTDTWRDKKDQLYEYFDEREIVSVLTQESLYTSMLIQSITPFWDINENSEAFFATVTIKQIVTIEDALAGLLDAAEDVMGEL